MSPQRGQITPRSLDDNRRCRRCSSCVAAVLPALPTRRVELHHAWAVTQIPCAVQNSGGTTCLSCKSDAETSAKRHCGGHSHQPPFRPLATEQQQCKTAAQLWYSCAALMLLDELSGFIEPSLLLDGSAVLAAAATLPRLDPRVQGAAWLAPIFGSLLHCF